MDDFQDAYAPLSRRTVIARMGWGSAAILASMSPVGAQDEASRAARNTGSGDDDALLARILSGPEPFIPSREQPYRITRTLPIEGSRTVLLEPGTRIVWAGPSQDGGRPIAVFQAMGDDVALAAAGDGEAFVECEAPRPFVYAAAMSGRRGFSVRGIHARNCQHVHVDSSVAEYEAVRTGEADRNIARDVLISGGGARFQSPPDEGYGACLLAYVAGARVRDVCYENVSHGIQWWGGDSGLHPWQNGARANERKCSGLLIERALVKNAQAGGVWGSMGRDVMVRDCQVQDCLDVGFDAEGCVDTVFERCTAGNSRNGCFATFFLNDRIRFVDCRGTVENKAWPLFRTYNVTQSNADNRDIAVEGGFFECLDPTGPGTMDCGSGPVRELAITGASLTNVCIDTFFVNMHRTRIADNQLTFSEPLPSVPAIRVGGSQGLPGARGEAIVAGNRIRYTVPPAAAEAAGDPVAIAIVENDYNASATSRVTGNEVSGPFAVGIALVNASGNAGIIPAFEIAGNRFEDLARSARLLSVGREGQASAPAIRWDAAQTSNGRAIGLDRALGGPG